MDVATVSQTAQTPAATPNAPAPTASALTGGAPLKAGAPDAAQHSLRDTAAAVFGAIAPSESARVSVHIANHPDESVTVFYDGQTHEVLATIPMQAIANLAVFFDKSTGVLLDEGV